MNFSERSPFPSEVQKALDQAQQEYQKQLHAVQADAFKHIVALVEDVRRCETLAHYRTVQQSLGRHIEHVDALAEEASRRRKRADEQIRRLPYQWNRQDADAATKLEFDRQQAESEHTLYVQLGHQYRMVGDALAWQLYEYDALRLYALGMNQSPGPISQSKKQGADKEQSTIEQFWQEHGAFTLRHDYTNCLRVRDLSVFFPDGSIATREVKVKKSVSPSQKRKGQAAIELVEHHESTLPEGGLLVH